jgi:hypothetical protein
MRLVIKNNILYKLLSAIYMVGESPFLGVIPLLLISGTLKMKTLSCLLCTVFINLNCLSLRVLHSAACTAVCLGPGGHFQV